MYGSQPEIQRIQSKLRQIGQHYPYRPMEQPESSDRLQRSTPKDTTPDLPVFSSRVAGSLAPGAQRVDRLMDRAGPRQATADLYNSAAGRQARMAMAQVSPVLGVATQADPVVKMPEVPTCYQKPASWAMTSDMASHHADTLAAQLRQQYSANRDSANQDSANQSFSCQGDVARSPIAPPTVFAAIATAIASQWRRWQWRRWQAQWNQPAKTAPMHPSPVNEAANQKWDPLSPEPTSQYSRRFLLPQAVRWFVGAMLVRVLIDGLLLLFPALQLVIMTIVLTPVAIALYQAAVNPGGSVHSGRRLLVIMMGLLIGGQL